MTLHLGCHYWTFPQCTVAEAAGVIRALGLTRMDLGNGRDFNPAEIAADPASAARRLRWIAAESGVTFVDAFPHVGPDFSLNHPDRALRADNRRVLAGFLDFAVAVGLAGVTVSPGRYWPGRAPRADFERAAGELRWLVAEGQARGLLVRIEPHIESVTWTPDLTLDMLAAVPGLSLTLDYSHFVFHAIPDAHIRRLDAYATHWHVRQAGPGRAQTSVSDGRVNFRRIAHDLKARGFDGTLCLEYVHGSWLGMNQVDCVSQTVLLRDELRRWL